VLPVDSSDDERPVSAIADIDTPTANVSVQSEVAAGCPSATCDSPRCTKLSPPVNNRPNAPASANRLGNHADVDSEIG